MLILLNGPPAAGKSTLARRWLDDHALALNLDLDVLWPLLGRWRDDLTATGLVARELALALCREQLAAGRDVIVPQYLGRPEFIDELSAIGGDGFRHVVVLPPFRVIAERFSARTEHPVAEAGLAKASGTEELRASYGRLLALAEQRSDARVLQLTGAETVDVLCGRLQELLAEEPPGTSGAG